jgi:hypothetical protein
MLTQKKDQMPKMSGIKNKEGWNAWQAVKDFLS